MIRHFTRTIALLLLTSCTTFAQVVIDSTEDDTDEDLLALLEDKNAETSKKEFTTATFKATRIINSHSVEQTGRGVLDFRISHRFNRLDAGFRDFFGLDGATTKLSFDFGLTDRIQIGVGRSNFNKEYDGYVKAKLLRQVDGGFPVTISYAGGMSIHSLPPNNPVGTTYYFSNRLFYYNQLLIAKKISEGLSIQIMPSHVHYNMVATAAEPNDVLALGVGGRLKLSKRISLNAEYFYQLPEYKLAGTVNSLSVGFDIETGGHVFQLHFTNSTGMTERTYIGQTTDEWNDGGVHFGFNISRVFTIVKPKGFENMRNSIK